MMLLFIGVSFGVRDGGSAALVLGECGAEGARRIFEPQGERVLSCGQPPSSGERLRDLDQGPTWTLWGPVGPLPAKTLRTER